MRQRVTALNERARHGYPGHVTWFSTRIEMPRQLAPREAA